MSQQNSSYQQALRDEEGWHDLSDRAAKLRERAEQLRHAIVRVQHVESAFQKSTRDGVQALQSALEHDPTNSGLLRVCVEQSRSLLLKNHEKEAQGVAKCGLSCGCGDALITLRVLYIVAKIVEFDIKNDNEKLINMSKYLIRMHQLGSIYDSDVADVIDLGRRSLEQSLLKASGDTRQRLLNILSEIDPNRIPSALEEAIDRLRVRRTDTERSVDILEKQKRDLERYVDKSMFNSDQQRHALLQNEIQQFEKQHTQLEFQIRRLEPKYDQLIENVEYWEKKWKKVSQDWLSYSGFISLFSILFLVLGIPLGMFLKPLQPVVTASIPPTSVVVSTNKPVVPTDEPVVATTDSAPTPSSITSTPVVPTTEPTTVSASTPPLPTVAVLPPNELVELAGWTYTLPYTNSSFFLKELDGVPSSKGRFIVVLMRVLNRGNESQILPPGFFQLRDDQGKPYQSRPDLQPYTNERAPILNDGNYRRLAIIFDVPADATGFSLSSTQNPTRGWTITPGDLVAAKPQFALVDSPQRDSEGWNYDFSGPTEVEKPLGIGGNPAREGYTFVVIRVRIMNGTNRAQSIDPLLFVLRDISGGIYLMQPEKMVTYFKRGGTFGEGSISKGEFQTRQPDIAISNDGSTWGIPLVFEVPQGATGLMLMNPLSPTTAWDIP